MQLYTVGEIEYGGKTLQLTWDGYNLTVQSQGGPAKVIFLNDLQVSPTGNVIIEFPHES